MAEITDFEIKVLTYLYVTWVMDELSSMGLISDKNGRPVKRLTPKGRNKILPYVELFQEEMCPIALRKLLQKRTDVSADMVEPIVGLACAKSLVNEGKQ